MEQFSIKPDSKTSLYGLLGNPVQHSLSPLIQNRAFLELGENSIYLAFAVEEEALPVVLSGVRALKMRGLNVTIPYKEKVLPYLDAISSTAAAMGAVNTIVHTAGRLIGYNTDGAGFVWSLREECQYCLQDRNVVIVGAGGAARGILLALLKEDVAHITIINRSQERLASLLSLLHHQKVQVPVKGLLFSQVDWREVLLKAHLFIQSTPVGMFPHHLENSPLPLHSLHPGLLVVDVVYNPMETALLARAKEKGCRTFGGWGMLLYQGALSFEKWTGKKAPISVMKEVLLDQLHSD